MLWNDLYLTYGNTFLYENGLEDDVLNSMDNLANSLLGKDVVRIFAAGNFSYGYFGGEFNYSAEYFIIDDGGNYASVSDVQALKYFERVIDVRDFLDWLYDSGYITEDSYLDLSNDI